MTFKNKHVVVIGGSSGIGYGCADYFRAASANVTTMSEQNHANAPDWVYLDVSKSETFTNMPEDIDILIYAAGIYPEHSFAGADILPPPEMAQRVIDINFLGAYKAIEAALPKLIKAQQPNIIVISSSLSLLPETYSPVYCASKAALNMLVKVLAQRFAPHKIRVNAVLPGPVDTPLLRQSFASAEDYTTYIDSRPIKTVSTPADIARVVGFLAADESQHITGALYSIDQGDSLKTGA